MMRTERAYPLRVKSAVLTVGLLLPVFPGEPTFSGSVGMSQRCQTQTPLHSITSSAQTSRVGGRCIAANGPRNRLILPSYGTGQTDF